MQAFGRTRAAVRAAALYHFAAVVEEHLQHPPQAHRLWRPVHQCHGIDVEGLLERGLPVQLRQQRLRIDPALDLDEQPQAVVAVSQVRHPGDTGEFLGQVQVLDALHHPLHTNVVGEFGDDDAASARCHLFYGGGGPHTEASAASEVSLAHAFKADDLPTGGKIRSGHVSHEVIDAGLRV